MKLRKLFLTASLALLTGYQAPVPAADAAGLPSLTDDNPRYADPVCNAKVKKLEKKVAEQSAELENCTATGQVSVPIHASGASAFMDKARKCAETSRRLEKTSSDLVQVRERCDKAKTGYTSSQNQGRVQPAAGTRAQRNVRVVKPRSYGKRHTSASSERSQETTSAGALAPLKAKAPPALFSSQEAAAYGDTGVSSPQAAAAPTALSGRTEKAFSSAGTAARMEAPKARLPGSGVVRGQRSTPDKAGGSSSEGSDIPRPVVYWAQGTSNILEIFGMPLGSLVDPKSASGSNGTTAGNSLVPVDETIWDFVNIDYPAALFPMADSIARGKAAVIKAIKSRPGPFALAGTSQGSIIMSQVYNEIRSGSLRSRRKDLIAGCQFGNPLRTEGKTFPGCPDPGIWNIPEATSGGHGCFPASMRLKDTEPLWLEFANVGDPICTAGDDAINTYLQFLANFLFLGRMDLRNLGSSIRHIVDLPAVIRQLAGIMRQTSSPGYVNPHVGYSSIPAYPGANETSSQIAAKYLNDAGRRYYENARRSAGK